MGTEVEAERQREMRQLRADLDRLRSVLDTDADRHIINGTATELERRPTGSSASSRLAESSSGRAHRARPVVASKRSATIRALRAGWACTRGTRRCLRLGAAHPPRSNSRRGGFPSAIEAATVGALFTGRWGPGRESLEPVSLR
jgi:hypothetical protein